MPLSGAGLWEAETTAPASACSAWVRYAAAGVGRMPPSTTSHPAESKPTERAACRRSPERRVSRTMTTDGWRCCERKAVAAARPRASASSGVRSRLATPRTPSVPNRRPTEGLPLGVLRGLASLLQSVLAPLLGPGVPGEHAGPLERDPELGVELDEGPGDGVADRPGLARAAAAFEQGVDVVGLLPADEPEGLQDRHA